MQNSMSQNADPKMATSFGTYNIEGRDVGFGGGLAYVHVYIYISLSLSLELP